MLDAVDEHGGGVDVQALQPHGKHLALDLCDEGMDIGLEGREVVAGATVSERLQTVESARGGR